jgi:hypothetical protein
MKWKCLMGKKKQILVYESINLLASLSGAAMNILQGKHLVLSCHLPAGARMNYN